MSENDEAAWQEYIDNYSRAFNHDTVTSNTSSSTSSSNTIMTSHESYNPRNHHHLHSTPNSMSDPFSSGDRLNGNGTRSPESQFLSSLFPSSTDHNRDMGAGGVMQYSHYSFDLGHNHSDTDMMMSGDDQQYTMDEENNMIARLHRLMDGHLNEIETSSCIQSTDHIRLSNAQQHEFQRRTCSNNQDYDLDESSPELLNNSAYNLSPDINLGRLPVDSGSDSDSLDQYLESYRHEQAQAENVGSSTNLDEWRRLSQPRNNDDLSEFTPNLSFTPFSSMGGLYTTTTSSTMFDNNISTNPNSAGKILRTKLTRLDNDLTRCEEKAESVQQMLEQIQGALRSSNAASSFTHEPSSLEDRPLTYTIDPEYEQWHAESTMANEAYLNFAFQYDSADELASVALGGGGLTQSFHQENSSQSHSHHNNNNVSNQRRVSPRRSRDMSPATREFHISIGYPVNNNNGGTDSNCIMIPDNPRSFPRNLLGDETPVPLFDGSNEDMEEIQEINNESQLISDSGVGSESDESSEEQEQNDSGIGKMEGDQGRDEPKMTMENKTRVVDANMAEMQSKFSLVDIENISNALWEQGVIPPPIDIGDFSELIVGNPSCSKFSDEAIDEIQKMVTEELEKDSSLSWDMDKCEESLDEDCDEKGEESQCSDREVKSEEDEVSLQSEDKDDEEEEESIAISGCEDTKSMSQKSQISQEEEADENERSTSSEKGEIESGAGGDTTYLEYSPSKISHFKAGLKNFKIKMCSCLANTKKCGVHSNTSTRPTSNPSVHGLSQDGLEEEERGQEVENVPS